jgi:Protein of unknown function (DUF3025)
VSAAETGLTRIDWHSPWLAGYRDVGQPIATAWEPEGNLADALNAAAPTPTRFISQSGLPPGEPYERYIFQTDQCPTRDNLHDFFNGLCWLHFPQTKKRLNQLQAAQIEADGIRDVRGAVRDALTVFDENAAFLHAPDALWDALLAKDWKTLFGDLRPMWRESHLVLFGHALLEKLVAPRKGITAHVYRVHPASTSLADLDAWVAADISASRLASKPFAHLPVLGVPGWWAANEDPGFYADSSVFRAPKSLEIQAQIRKSRVHSPKAA